MADYTTTHICLLNICIEEWADFFLWQNEAGS